MRHAGANGTPLSAQGYGFSTSSAALVLASHSLPLLGSFLHPGPEGPSLMSHGLSSWGSSFPCFHFLNWYSLHAKPYCALPCSGLPLLTLPVLGLGAELRAGIRVCCYWPPLRSALPLLLLPGALPDLLTTVTISVRSLPRLLLPTSSARPHQPCLPLEDGLTLCSHGTST